MLHSYWNISEHTIISMFWVNKVEPVYCNSTENTGDDFIIHFFSNYVFHLNSQFNSILVTDSSTQQQIANRRQWDYYDALTHMFIDLCLFIFINR